MGTWACKNKDTKPPPPATTTPTPPTTADAAVVPPDELNKTSKVSVMNKELKRTNSPQTVQ